MVFAAFCRLGKRRKKKTKRTAYGQHLGLPCGFCNRDLFRYRMCLKLSSLMVRSRIRVKGLLFTAVLNGEAVALAYAFICGLIPQRHIPLIDKQNKKKRNLICSLVFFVFFLICQEPVKF